MHYECRFVGLGQVFAVRIEVCRVLGGARSAILERVSNSRPRLRLVRWQEASGTGGRGAIGYTFENVDAIPPEAPDFSRDRFCNRRGVRRNNQVAAANAC